MPNQNGLKCPKCGQDDRFHVVMTTWTLVTDNGSDPDASELPDHSHEWGDDAPCVCPKCQHSGTVEDFEDLEDFDEDGEPRLSTADYLRNLAERLRHIPVVHGTDGGDVDRLLVIAQAIQNTEAET